MGPESFREQRFLSKWTSLNLGSEKHVVIRKMLTDKTRSGYSRASSWRSPDKQVIPAPFSMVATCHPTLVNKDLITEMYIPPPPPYPGTADRPILSEY
jgi:hypothetical protein